MAVEILTGYTKVAIPYGSDFRVLYPSSSRTPGQYTQGGEVLSIPSRQYIGSSPDFTVVYNSDGTARIRWLGAFTIPAGTLVRLQATLLEDGTNPTFVNYVDKLSLPVTRTVAFTGDSRLARGFTTTANVYGTAANGLAPWIELLTGARVRCPFEYNFAVSGYTTSQCLTTLSNVLATDATFVVVLQSINDSKTSVANVELVKSNLTTQINAIRASGKTAIVVCELPRGPSGAFTGSTLSRHLEIAAWLRQWHGTLGVHVIDAWDLVGDQTVATGAYQSGMSSDGLHPNAYADYLIATRIAQVINILVPPVNQLPPTSGDVYDAVECRHGNLITNGLMTGTAGTKSITTGNIADNWTANSPNADMAVVGSKVTSSLSGRPMQQLAFTTTALGANRTFQMFNTPFSATAQASLSEGDIVEGICEYECDAGATNMLMLGLLLQFTVGGTAYHSRGMDTPSFNPDCIMPAVAHNGILRTPRLTIPPGAITFGLAAINVYALSGTTGGCTVRVGSVAVRKIN